MFLVHHPSREAIDRFLRQSQELPLSYGPIGIVRGEAVRHNLDEAIVSIGHGKADFERARAALVAWKQFDIGWVETFPRQGACRGRNRCRRSHPPSRMLVSERLPYPLPRRLFR